MSVQRQSLDFDALKGLILDGLGKSGKDFIPSYEDVSTLLDKIGLVFSTQSSIIDHLAIFDGPFLPLATTVEEYVTNLLDVADFDRDATPFGQDLQEIKRAYHYRSTDKKIELPIFRKEMTRAFTTQEGVADFIARQIVRMEDTYNQYKYESKLLALGSKLVDDIMEIDESNDATAVKAPVEWKTLNAAAKETVYGPHEKPYVYIKVDDGDSGYDYDVIDKATGEEFILAVQTLVRSMKFTNQKYNIWGIPQQARPSDLVLLIDYNKLPIMNVRTLAGVFHKDLLALGVELVEVDGFGIDVTGIGDLTKAATDLGVYAVLADRRMLRYMPTLLETTTDVVGVARKVLYTKHFGENIVISNGVNYVAFTNDSTIAFSGE